MIQDPLKNKQVLSILSFLINNVNLSVKYASILKVEYQVVNGYNFKLTISFDSSSNAVYVITVFRSRDGKCSVKSIQLANVSDKFTFREPLTADQIKKLPFLNTLQSLIVKEEASLQTPETKLLRIYMSFPYFRFVFTNQQFGRLNIDVKYEIFGKKLTIIAKSGVGRPAQPQAPIAQTQPAPIAQTQPAPQPEPQSQLPPPPSPPLITHTSPPQKTSCSRNSGCDDGFSPISSTLAHLPFIQAFVRYLEAKDSRLCAKNLDGIYWKNSDKNFLRYRFILPNG